MILINEELDLKDNGTLSDYAISLNINGRPYEYVSNSNTDIMELYRKFRKISYYSKGRALSWLKKNTRLANDKDKEIIELRSELNSATSDEEYYDILDKLEELGDYEYTEAELSNWKDGEY